MYSKVIFICLVAVTATNAYGRGAPTGACSDMIPRHPVDPQTSRAPYEVQVSKNKIRSDDTVDVTIRGLKPSDTIKGFMVQARVGETPVGIWLVNKNHAYAQTLSCGSGNDVSLLVSYHPL